MPGPGGSPACCIGKGHMITPKLMKVACAAGLTAVCLCTATACASDGSAEGLTGGVAATVNGVEIPEDDITVLIQDYREANGLDDEAMWGLTLASSDYTPEQLREDYINAFVEKDLIEQGAEERGVTVEDSEIEETLDKMKANYSSDEKWQAALEGAGFEDEDAYRDNIRTNLLQQKLYDSFAPEDPSDQEILDYASGVIADYDGAKRSSHILFNSTDKETAQEVLDKINAGELDFADAAAQYSIDTGSAQEGGDVGWDKLTTFVDEYQQALDGLSAGQMSGLVESSYGYHIILCTDQFTAPAQLTSLDQLPEEFVESFKSSLTDDAQLEAYQEWYDQFKADSEIVVNDMPEGLPYDVDLSQYQTDDGTDAAADEGSDGSAEGEGSKASADAGAEAADGSTEDAAESESEGGDEATQDAA